MKITLDLSKLQEEGKITAQEAERLKSLAAPGMSALGISILIGFGVVSVAASAVALVPVPATAIAIGVAVFAAGFAIAIMAAAQWHLLAQICLVIGALMFSGGVIAYGEGSLASLADGRGGAGRGCLVVRSNLLMVGAVMALAACWRAHRLHACELFAGDGPAGRHHRVVRRAGARRLPRLANGRPRTTKASPSPPRAPLFCWSISDFAFVSFCRGYLLRLLRSLASGNPAILDESLARGAIIPAYVFSILWAVALLVVGVWGAKANRRWVVNVAAVFGAIYFYTQWFERLGANALSVLLGGLLMLAFGLALWTFNRRAETKKAS